MSNYKLKVEYFDVQKEFPISVEDNVLQKEVQRAVMTFLYGKGRPKMEIGDKRELKITITKVM